MAICKSCGAEIIWIRTNAKKKMPCNAQLVYYKERAKGTKRVVTPNGMVLACEYTDNPNEATGVGYIPHWATCNSPDSFRRSRK